MKKIIALIMVGLGINLVSALNINYDFEGWKLDSKLPSGIIQKIEKKKISNMINSKTDEIKKMDPMFIKNIKDTLTVNFYKFSPNKNLLFVGENMGNMVIGKNFVKLFGESNRLENISNSGVILSQELNDGKFFPIVDYQKNITDPNGTGCYSKYDIAKTFINSYGKETYSLEKNLLYSWIPGCDGDKKSAAQKANFPTELIEKITESNILPISNQECKKIVFDEKNGGDWICQN